MIFKDFIEDIAPIFLENKFRIIEQFENYIKFESDTVTFTFTYDKRERSLYTYFGRKDSNLIELSGNLDKEVFNADASFYKEDSVKDNLMYFLTGPGLLLLKGDMTLMKRAEDYSKQRNKEYHNKIILQQKINSLDASWKYKEYNDYIKCFESTDKSLLPESYAKKYAIAIKKTKG